MKVLQINFVFRYGSTGRSVAELDAFLQKNGIDSYVAYGFGARISNSRFYRAENRFEYWCENIRSRLFGDEGFGSHLQTKRLLKWIDKIKPDVVHLQDLHGHCFNVPMILNYLAKHKEILTVITTHDFWFLTGKCPMLQCDKWMTHCGNCAYYHDFPKSWFFDRTRSLFEKKKKLLLKQNHMLIMGVSSFCEDVIKKSFLKEKKLCFVYNWIDLEKFYPRNQKPYQFADGKPVVLCVWSLIPENSERFLDYLHVSEIMKNDAHFILIGKHSFQNEKYPSIIFRQDTESIDELATFYSSADVFFDPSTNDTFGKVVAESLACGTPAVVYNSWALPEVVSECGISVAPHDFKSVILAIKTLIQKGKSYYSTKCIERARTLFDYNKNCAQILEYYLKNQTKDQ